MPSPIALFLGLFFVEFRVVDSMELMGCLLGMFVDGQNGILCILEDIYAVLYFHVYGNIETFMVYLLETMYRISRIFMSLNVLSGMSTKNPFGPSNLE